MTPRTILLLGLLASPLPLAAADAPAAPAEPAAAEVKPLEIAATDEAALKAAVGQLATVRGKVTRANAWEGGITFLNFEGAFTAVCFKKHYGAFPTPPDQLYAAGKTLEVTGKLSLHKGKVQIEITRPDQVKVLESPAPAAAPATGEAPAASGEKPARP